MQPVVVDAPARIIGQTADCRITGTGAHSLLGELVIGGPELNSAETTEEACA